MIDDDETLNESLERATSLLREKPAVSAEWKEALLSRLDQPDAPVMNAGYRWSMRPFAAIAAGILCAIVGGAATLAVVNSHNSAMRSDISIASAEAPVANALSSQVRFELVAPSAGRVSVVGDFNGWNPASLPLRRAGDGRTWEVVVPLPPGRYAYAFMVDGHISRDPVAPQGAGDDFGVANSIVLVKGS
jgi:predicted carbohydrate-binding protein with CBM48